MRLKRYALGLAAVGISSAALAQPPIVGPAAAPQPATLGGFLGINPAQRQARQDAQAATPFGTLRGAVQQPASTMTGGLIKPFPNPQPTQAQLQAPGAIGAAAQVKMDRANAEKRMEAVEYLGTVDCHYWPEAEGALIGALRGDRNECVRLQAANVLLNGCCCTKKVIKALSEAAAGTDCDGFPAETSCRVRAAAQTALEHCLTCFCDMESKCPEKDCDKKKPPADLVPAPKSGSGAMADAYYDRVAMLPAAQIIADARKAVVLPIPIESNGPSINQHDLVAAGEPGPGLARFRSPRQSSFMAWLNSSPSSSRAVRQASATSTVVVSKPASKPAPMATSVPNSSKGYATSAGPTTVPAARSMPVSHLVPSQSIPVSQTVPAPKPIPAQTMPVNHTIPQVNRAEQVSRMMKGFVPVSELAGAIDQLTAEDLKGTPSLTSDLISAGARSSNVRIRLATVQALVRCRITTPECGAILQTTAQTDPEMSIRAAALAGLAH